MANPQAEDGHIRIANKIWDAFCRTRIPGEARQVLDVIIRKTWGWGKDQEKISLSGFQKATGIGKSGVIRALEKLKLMNLIQIYKTEKVNSYAFNKNFDEWVALSKKKMLYKRKSILLDHCYICKFKEALHKHHIIPIRQGGQDKVCNKIILCPNCHALVHKGKYSSDYLIILKDNSERIFQKDNADFPKRKSELSKKITQTSIAPLENNDLQATKATFKKTTSSKDIKTLVERTEKFNDLFWPVYPPRNGKRLNKAKALERFLKAPEKDIDNILLAVRNYQTSKEVKDGIGIKDAFRWIRDKCYKDWIAPEEKPIKKEDAIARELREIRERGEA